LDTQAAAIAGTAEDTTLETAITLTASIAAYLLENGYQFQLFYWEQPDGGDDPHESNILSHLLPRLTTEKTSHNPAQVRRYDARNIKNLGDTLRALAEIKPVHDETATLTHLAQSALPHIPAGRSTLLIASTLADIDSALKVLSGTTPGGMSSHALALDAANFNAPAATAKATESTEPALLSSPKFTIQARDRVRLVQRNDPVATVLDQLL
ncbi:MAG: hypothetical protein JOZ57_11815, partial [Abitibacteriaceae bacterium]|nr:hypothetical protein [Abditibacteriaceae bacterium]